MSKKNYVYLLLFSAILLFVSGNSFAQSQVLTKGASAPIFKAKASLAGNDFNFALNKALEKGPVVLYFYPSAYTGTAASFIRNPAFFLYQSGTEFSIFH
jgi:thioredoxin-dependent peroxiredoxin